MKPPSTLGSRTASSAPQFPIPHFPFRYGQRGFAILTVLGVVMIVLIYLVTVHGAVERTMMRGRASARSQAAADRLAEAITLALAQETVPTSDDYRVTRRPLPANDPLWARMGLLKPMAGDELLTVDAGAEVPEVKPIQTRLIVNRQGRRPGPVILDRQK